MHNYFAEKPIPAKAGIGLRYPHYQEIISTLPDIAWLEVHPENFFAQGGVLPQILSDIRANYPLSFHGVGLSLGSVTRPNLQHLQKLKELITRFNPHFVSEHISWSEVNKLFLNDLLPVPYNKESMSVLINNINYTQEYLGRQIFVENPSTYLEFINNDMPEYEFIREICKRCGCKVLLDINNIYVSSVNNGFDAKKYINNVPAEMIGEIHLAGHSKRDLGDSQILIDSHSDYVCDEVWCLYNYAIGKFGAVPTLIEWDKDIPALNILLSEAQKAQDILSKRKELDNAA